MFNFIKQKLQKIFTYISSKLSAFWSKTTVDEQTLKELELILLQADTGIITTRAIIAQLKQDAQSGIITDGMSLRNALEKQLIALLQSARSFSLPGHAEANAKAGNVYLLVGVNGCGKTTLASKLAHQAIKQGKRPLLVAADTFRAAATEQLETWAQRTGCALEKGTQGQDPASVVFNGTKRFVNEKFDTLIIDTAGRLQTKSHLMAELSKIKRIVAKNIPDQSICTLLTVDAMLGQNSFEQAKLFNESTDVSGIVLTKMDSTGKGGIIFSITQEFGIPVAYISFGEHVDDIKSFNIQEYVQELLG